VDVDLLEKDTFPLHGSLELNNRYSPDTTQLRLNGAMSYDNLWQLGHSIGGSFQLSPENPGEVKVFSGHYMLRVPQMNWLSLRLHGTKQESAVSTIGSSAVAGRGEVVGIQAIMLLPGGKAFSNTLSLGLDYKKTDQDVTSSGGLALTQTSYYYFPLSATYSAAWLTKTDQIELNVGPVFSFRGLGSSPGAFGGSRVGSDGAFFYLRGDLSHTHDFAKGFQLHEKIQGQVAGKALVSAEQFGGGGLGTVRGYIEGEAFGDNAFFGSVELRSPSLLGFMGNKVVDGRVYLFAEGGRLSVFQPQYPQHAHVDMASFGVGSRVHFLDRFNGSLDLGVPIITQIQPSGHTKAYDLHLTFRVWVEL